MKSGLDTSHIHPKIRPQDDLFRHMNGQWLDTAEIPADRASDGAFYKLIEDAEQQVREIIEELAGTPQEVGTNSQKVGDLYAAFMNESLAEDLGIKPIRSDLDRALSLTTLDQFHALLGEFELRGVGGLFYEYVTNDNRDSTTNIAYLGQSGLSLPDEAYYREAEYVPIRTAFVSHMTKMFDLAGVKNGSQHAHRVLELETLIASHHWDQVRDRDALLTYNKFTFAELQQLSTGFNWPSWMSASQTPERIIATTIVRQPSFFTGVGKLLQDFDAPAWSSWLAWHALSGAAPYLSSEFVDQNFSFYGTTLSGIPTLRERWKRGVGLVEGVLGEALGEVYVQRYFPPEAKTQMVELVKNLIEAYRREFLALDWMEESTKQKAVEKLEKFTPKIGYPDKWRDYSALEISPIDLHGNLARITKYCFH